MTKTGPYLTKVRVDNLRAIRHLTWELPDDTRPEGWHVIIGDNGSGKSTLLDAISLALLGGDAPKALRLRPDDYVRHGSGGPSGCTLTLADRSQRRWDANRPTPKKGRPPAAGFHAAFGPVRRFEGGYASRRLEAADSVTARHASLFDPTWALGDLVQWLKDLRLAEVDGQAPDTLARVTAFINQPGLLPGLTFAAVNADGPRFRDPSGEEVGIEALSDGYQSAVGLALELLRQLLTGQPIGAVLGEEGGRQVVRTPGIVLIDEVDAHLHPTWQQQIGVFLREHFPKIQFLVTTHSPLVCRAADKGTIFRLPRAGVDEAGTTVTGQARDRLLFGDVLDAYGTEVFGAGITRSRPGQAKFDRLAALNVKASFGDALTKKEEEERTSLQAQILPVTAP